MINVLSWFTPFGLVAMKIPSLSESIGALR